MSGGGKGSVCDDSAAICGLAVRNSRAAFGVERGGYSREVQPAPKFRCRIASTLVPAFLKKW